MGLFHTFFESVRIVQERHDTFVCLGLNPTEEGIFRRHNRSLVTLGMSDHKLAARIRRNELEARLRTFCDTVISEAAPNVCAIKIGASHFGALAAEGIMEEAIFSSKMHDVPVILDLERSGIGESSFHAAREAFVRYGADAVTVNPFMGFDSVEAFLKHEDTGILLHCHLPNPGVADFQNAVTQCGLRLYEIIAHRAKAWDSQYGKERIALVMGAHSSEELVRVREIVGDMPIFIPSFGEFDQSLDIAVQGIAPNGYGLMVETPIDLQYSTGLPFEISRFRQKIKNALRTAKEKGLSDVAEKA